MYVDAQDSLSISLFGVYEPETTDLVKRILKPGDVFLDIGANVGWYTLLAAGLVGETGRVIAFEPEPANFALLQQNIALNGYHNVVPVQKAVSDRDGAVTLYLSETNKGNHSLHDSGAGRAPIVIDAVRLDEYFGATAGKIDLIKMDIEGAEGRALNGMLALLATNPDVKIIAEFSPQALEQCGTPPADVLALLGGRAFSFYTIGEHSISAVSPETLLRSYGGEQEKHTNILCMRGDSTKL
jgi:FkbM family methyltransferase